MTFLLPRSMLLRVPEGRHTPCLAGVTLKVDRGLVTIEAPSRERCFDQARRLLRVHAKGLPAMHCSALIETPRREGGGRDGWTIIVNSEVSFTPTTIDPDIESRPQLTIMSAG